MITLRKAGDRGQADHGWLKARHTFSFANYYDPNQMGFRALRVINEDVVAPGAGFPAHSHRDMEIITYVLEGGVAHQDSTGGGGVIHPGDVQYMSAGSGVTHSEYNASQKAPVHLLQIWLLPNERGLKPRYAQKSFGDARNDRLCLVASPDGRDGSLRINQDADLYAAVLSSGVAVEYRFAAGRYGWLQLARGRAEIAGERLEAGDAARIENEAAVRVRAVDNNTEFLLFDLS